MRKSIFTLFAFLIAGAFSSTAHAIQTASSFDISYSFASLTVDTAVDGDTPDSRSLVSPTGIQIDYNVALFDYKTVASISFTQYQSSNIGARPLTRIALGASYHFIRMNGQRMILDNQVEGKAWGISPALELTVGLGYLSIKDPQNQNLSFTSSMFDVSPRLLIEVPASPSFLLMFRLGILKSLGAGGSSRYQTAYSGFVANVGFKLTTF